MIDPSNPDHLVRRLLKLFTYARLEQRMEIKRFVLSRDDYNMIWSHLKYTGDYFNNYGSPPPTFNLWGVAVYPDDALTPKPDPATS